MQNIRISGHVIDVINKYIKYIYKIMFHNESLHFKNIYFLIMIKYNYNKDIHFLTIIKLFIM